MTNFPSFLPSFGDSTVALHMENNRISDLKAATWQLRNNSSFSRVTQLYLTSNSLKTFSHMFLPSNLTHLHLDHNSLSQFESRDLTYFHRLLIKNQLKLKLGNNPYDCGVLKMLLRVFEQMKIRETDIWKKEKKLRNK